ncbi:hypothetical protein N0B51_05440 [Tsuneonella sp. YG55]|uniref:Uncharacterized protein n=1 Tax=Tsuneonella litorea TaxID=2976475 RepID=A0A9X2W0S5_9SPHN|nr:hypothetical protein [Tsuneonella litorea]MCT2558419.1 hypothetical protein [Tsuneonella litorea]
MTTNTRVPLRSAVNAKCRECIYDPYQRGTWREQVAACCSANCSLHEVRPVPRDCMNGGRICPAKIAAVRAKLEA